MKCWRQRKAVSPVRMAKFCGTSLRLFSPWRGDFLDAFCGELAVG